MRLRTDNRATCIASADMSLYKSDQVRDKYPLLYPLPSSRQLSQAIHAENKPGSKPLCRGSRPHSNGVGAQNMVSSPLSMNKTALVTENEFGVSVPVINIPPSAGRETKAFPSQ